MERFTRFVNPIKTSLCKIWCMKDKVELSSNTKYFLVFLIVRLASIFFVQTWYAPDEYWQSMEVAHKIAFGYGYKTWEWTLGIRSYIHPLIIAILYQILALIGLDNVNLLIFIPRLCQALLSAYADLKFYHWSGNHKWAAFNIACSWFWFYTGSRTLINTFETSISMIALANFPWKESKNQNNNFLWLVAFICVIRPTAAIMWLPLCTYHVLSTERSLLKNTLLKYILIGIITLMLSIIIDSFFHGQLIVTQWEFLKLNVLQDVGSWYGMQPWHWYLSTGLPTVLGINLIPFTLAVLQCIRHRDIYRTNLVLLATMVFTIAILSLLPHKEFRFVLPLLPIAVYISSDLIARWSCKANTMLLWFVAGIIFASNIVPAIYLGMIHQRGTMDVMKPISELAEARPKDTSFLILMPCHSTPLYSHIHVNVPVRFLTCEPDLKGVGEGYKDEAEQFYDNPNKWLHSEYPPDGALPSHIITFDTLVPALSSILSRYKPIYRLPHANVQLSSRTGYHVIVHQHVEY